MLLTQTIHKPFISRYVWAAAIISGLLGVWAANLGSAINNDGVLYLLTAEAYLKGGWVSAVQIYPWPFLSILIAWVSQLGMTPETAAYCINIVAAAVMASGFVRAVSWLSDDHLTFLLALILISTLPALNSLRSEVVRDLPFLACLIWFFERTLAYSVQHRLYQLAQAMIIIGVAFLFRLEAVIYATAIPVLPLLASSARAKKRLRHSLVVGLFFFLAILAVASGIFESGRHTRLHDLSIWWRLLASSISHFEANATNLSVAVLPPVINNYGRESMLAIFFVVLIGKFLKNATWLHVGFVLFMHRGISEKVAPATIRMSILMLLIGLLPPSVFIFLNGFMTGRYVFPCALAFLLWVPLAYRYWLCGASKRAKVLLIPLLVGLLLYGNVSEFSPHQRVAKVAGSWLSTQTGTIWCNDRALCYYSGQHDVVRDRTYNWRGWLEQMPNEIANYHWVAVQLRVGQLPLKSQLEAIMKREPEKVFTSESGDIVFVYRQQR